MKSLNEICVEIAEFEGKLMYGEVNFSYDRLLSVMGAGHPAEILDSILAPVFWPLMGKQEVPIENVVKLYNGLVEFKNEFQIKGLAPMIADLQGYLTANGVDVSPKKVTLKELNELFVGKTLDMEKFRAAGDVWNLAVHSGEFVGHFYWNNERHRYYDEISILVDDNMTILAVNPLETFTADGGNIIGCRYTLVHNGEFKRLLAAGTE